jgi:anti-sigma-K factor RskA
MPSQLHLDRQQRNRQRWQRRLSTWGFAILVLAALAVVVIELLT